MLLILTKTRHIKKINNFLNKNKIKHEIFTVKNFPVNFDQLAPFDLGVSYCFPRLVEEPLLSLPKNGFINYHPAPLPEYKGKSIYEDGIKDNVTYWGVSIHRMDKTYDTGKIIKVVKFELHDTPEKIDDLAILGHYFLFNLFKETIAQLTRGEQISNPKYETNYDFLHEHGGSISAIKSESTFYLFKCKKGHYFMGTGIKGVCQKCFRLYKITEIIKYIEILKYCSCDEHFYHNFCVGCSCIENQKNDNT